ncbi:hypothetical protein Cgig2_020589 [Carnegiea gigantea]|uniref:Uncharacterized protein n=1 Tax=Carnegiea gigantea TaxID=171969 RepID=A0A9Q1Q8Q2_9CARY|nr:hypothetical protein Cgig2_020589 [Carnegiea gigantea]
MLTASEPQTISDSTPAPSPARPASPTQTPSPAASCSTVATPSVPTRTPPPSPPPSHTEVSSILRPAPLPYANLLTHVFRHFGVSLTNEVFATKPVPIITPAAFISIQLLKTDHSGWKFVNDMTPVELLTVSQSPGPHIPPRIPLAQSPPPSSLLDQIQHLDERLYELQETANKLEYILVEHTVALDGIAHNQAIMDNRLNRIQTLLTTHITEQNGDDWDNSGKNKDEFERLKAIASQSGTKVDEDELFLQFVGGKNKKGTVYGLGTESEAYHPRSARPSASSSSYTPSVVS